MPPISIIREALDIPSYLLLTKAQADRIGVSDHPTHLAPYPEEFEHFGKIDKVAHDLGAAWDAYQAAGEKIYISKEDALWSGEVEVPGEAPVIWDYLVLPEHKKIWMNMLSVSVEGGPGDRHWIGTDYHCVHEEADVRFKIIDWRPFDYFSALEVDPLGSGLSYRETWEIVPAGDNWIVRFSVEAPGPGEGRSEPATDEETGAIQELYEAYGMPMPEGLRTYLAGGGADEATSPT